MDPRATIVVVPRERFSYTSASLESIYEHTPDEVPLVYVDGGSPSHVRRYLEDQARARGFQLIRTEHHLAPNVARNIGLEAVETEYTVFLDNDVVVAPGYLEHLIECADETGAAVVGPLTCIGNPVHEKIHIAGGDCHIDVEEIGGQSGRHVHERLWHAGLRVERVREKLSRQRCELAEFHGVLIRTEFLRDIGGLDENLLNTREHLDLCLTVERAGGSVWFEPASVLTYVPGPPFERSDLRFFMLRWSDAWEMASLRHFRLKWDLTEGKFFQDRYERLGWRRRVAFLRPLSRRLSLGRPNSYLERALIGPDRLVNRAVTRRYAKSLPEQPAPRRIEAPAR